MTLKTLLTLTFCSTSSNFSTASSSSNPDAMLVDQDDRTEKNRKLALLESIRDMVFDEHADDSDDNLAGNVRAKTSKSFANCSPVIIEVFNFVQGLLELWRSASLNPGAF